jgi:metal-responsive CopG/Arc/MetJ family transcriptional regulator
MVSETIAASVPKDSELYERFDEYRRSHAIVSKSEATRELLQIGLQTEFDYGGNKTIVDGNESLLLTLAYIISAEQLLGVMVAIAGAAAGAVIFAAAGTLLVSWLVTDYQPRILYSRLRKVRS